MKQSTLSDASFKIGGSDIIAKMSSAVMETTSKMTAAFKKQNNQQNLHFEMDWCPNTQLEMVYKVNTTAC